MLKSDINQLSKLQDYLKNNIILTNSVINNLDKYFEKYLTKTENIRILAVSKFDESVQAKSVMNSLLKNLKIEGKNPPKILYLKDYDNPLGSIKFFMESEEMELFETPMLIALTENMKIAHCFRFFGRMNKNQMTAIKDIIYDLLKK